MVKILGLDIAAKEKNQTGYYFKDLKNKIKKYGILYKNNEILDFIINYKPNIIIFDSPISYKYPYRIEEKYLYKMKFHPFPLSIKSMKDLTFRTINIIKIIKSNDINAKIFESFPRAVEKILNINKNKLMKKFKIEHVYDAYLCYLAGLFYYKKYYIRIRNLILPENINKIKGP